MSKQINKKNFYLKIKITFNLFNFKLKNFVCYIKYNIYAKLNFNNLACYN